MSIKEVTSLYAAKFIDKHENSKLIDVRTESEWQKVGIPQLSHQRLILLSWRLLPNMYINPVFESNFSSAVNDKNIDLFFICKSGARSQEAAEFVSKLGYINCHNIIDGFEGAGSLKGWKNNNLPCQVQCQYA